MADLMQSLSIPQILFLQWMGALARYAVLAGGGWLVFWKWFYPKWKARRLSDRDPEPGQLRREILLSAVSMTIFVLPIAGVLFAARSGYSKLYLHAADYGWGWYFASYAVLFLWHDTYFYWTHRLMHWTPIYRLMHKTHHLSRYTTPFTSFSFHPLEAFVESLAIVSLTFVIPVHVGVTAIFTLFSLAFNVYGHMGIRLVPHRGIWKYFNGPESHGAHHERFRGNYSLYMNVWDRVMGTWIPEGASRGSRSGNSSPATDDDRRGDSPARNKSR